jgi:hypothetical protein
LFYCVSFSPKQAFAVFFSNSTGKNY